MPRFSIDGWTFSGTPARLRRLAAGPDLRDLETLLHGVAVEVDTPYTYERAAMLLERAGEHGPALSVCEAWLALRRPAGPSTPTTPGRSRSKGETAGPVEAGVRRAR